MIRKILNKIRKKKINVLVIGLGYVGLPLCMRLIDKNILKYAKNIIDSRGAFKNFKYDKKINFC